MPKKIKVKTPLHFDAAIQHYHSGNLQQAEMICRQILLKTPNHADALHLTGLIKHHSGQYDSAIFYISRAIYINPAAYLYYYNLGIALADKGLIDEAIKNFKKVMALKPDYAEGYNNLGTALAKKDLVNEAIENYKKAIELKPDFAEAYNNIGNVFKDKGMLNEAIENYKKALMIKPDFFEVYDNLGITLEEKGMLNEAIENYRKALLLNPDAAEIHANLGTAYLLARDFERGWEEYEWRLKTITVPSLAKPKWDGSPLKGKTILVYHEQGYGDTLQFVRYLPKLSEEFGANKVLFIPQKGLEQLLRESDLKAEILNPSASVETLEYDTNIHLLSLPRIFKTNLDNIPFKQKRYLKANPEKVKWYREKYFNNTPLPPLNRGELKLRVGIFWQGNPALKPDRNRSMPLHHFYPLCRLSNVKVYSLQKSYGIEQLNNLPEDIEIINLGETFNDFSDTAAAIENLDLMITVDSAVGHLAGALGKRTWILLPSHVEWRWHLDIDYSPWYEDVRLFRHREPGKKDWEEMMERVKEQVEVEIKNR